MINRLIKKIRSSDGEWINISDLMSALMMIFLFIAISFMNNLQIRANQVRQIAVAYEELQDNLYADLANEFTEEELESWNASIDQETLSIRFHGSRVSSNRQDGGFEEPDVMFKQSSDVIEEPYRDILSEFFPRYIEILNSDKYRDDIEEIRIEGHTNSSWEDPDEDAYMGNMRLSQDRTRAVLSLCLGLSAVEGDSRTLEFARTKTTANGLSSSRLIRRPDGSEDSDGSRRVEFRTKTAAERKVVEIIRELER